MEVSFQHSLVEQHVAHWFRNDHVDLLWQFDFFDFARKDFDDMIYFIGEDEFFCVLGYTGTFHSVNLQLTRKGYYGLIKMYNSV